MERTLAVNVAVKSVEPFQSFLQLLVLRQLVIRKNVS